MFFRFNILSVLPSREHVLLNGFTRTMWFRSRIQTLMASQKRGAVVPPPEDMPLAFAQKALYTAPIPASISRWLMIVGEGA